MYGYKIAALVSTLIFCLASFIVAGQNVFSTDSLAPQKDASLNGYTFEAKPYAPQRDIAFVSTMGRTPDIESMQGFQKAVLYNAKGAIIQEVNISRADSVYSLDKMIKENSSRGPVIIRMVR